MTRSLEMLHSLEEISEIFGAGTFNAVAEHKFENALMNIANKLVPERSGMKQMMSPRKEADKTSIILQTTQGPRVIGYITKKTRKNPKKFFVMSV